MARIFHRYYSMLPLKPTVTTFFQKLGYNFRFSNNAATLRVPAHQAVNLVTRCQVPFAIFFLPLNSNLWVNTTEDMWHERYLHVSNNTLRHKNIFFKASAYQTCLAVKSRLMPMKFLQLSLKYRYEDRHSHGFGFATLKTLRYKFCRSYL